MCEILTLFPYTKAEDSFIASKVRSEKFKRLSEYETMVPLLMSENERLKAKIKSLEEAGQRYF